MAIKTGNQAEEMDAVGQDDTHEQKKEAPERVEPAVSGQDDSAAADEQADQQPGERPETLEEAQARAEENWNKYLRVTAEMENIRKRGARELEYARKYGVERFARELLTVLDSLEMGLEMGRQTGAEGSGESGASVESLLEGKKATLNLLLAAMKNSRSKSWIRKERYSIRSCMKQSVRCRRIPLNRGLW